MLKKALVFLLLMAIINSLLFTGCGSSVADKVKKDDAEMADQPAAKIDAGKDGDSKPSEESDAGEKKNEDLYNYYDLNIVEEWKGLKVEILALALGEQIESDFQESPVDVVVLKFRIENTRGEGELTVYPDQGTLITSTGEQLEPDIWESDHIGGDIYEGVIKDGIVIWVLERGHVFDLEWIRIKFNAYDENADIFSDNYSKDFDIKIDIPK